MRTRPGVDDDSTAERSPGRLVTDDETVTAERQERLRKNDLAKCGLFGSGDGRRPQQDQLGHPFSRSQMHSDALMVLDPCPGRRPHLE